MNHRNPGEPQLRVACTWNVTHERDQILVEGDPGAPTSHMICPGCYEKEMEKLKKRKNPDADLRELKRRAAGGEPAAVARLIQTRLITYGDPLGLHAACVTLHRIVRSIVTPHGGRVGHENRRLGTWSDRCSAPNSLMLNDRFLVHVMSKGSMSHYLTVDFNLALWAATISTQFELLERPHIQAMAEGVEAFARGMGMDVTYGRIAPGVPYRDDAAVYPKKNPPRALKSLRKAVGRSHECYPAAEVLYHNAGGSHAGLIPMQQRHEGRSHWWVQGPKGQAWDPATAQFRRPVPYSKGKGRGFLTKRPSKRARALARRADMKLNPDVGIRELERAAADGDVGARVQLARARIRAGIRSWDDDIWTMDAASLARAAQRRVEDGEDDVRNRRLGGSSAYGAAVMQVALRRGVLSPYWLARQADVRRCTGIVWDLSREGDYDWEHEDFDCWLPRVREWHFR